MNRYQISSPRKVFAIASVAMTAIIIGVSVIVPAKIQSGTPDLRTLAPIEVVASRSKSDVVRVREPELVTVRDHNVPPKHKQES
jgi:hypothetical protein